MCSRLPINSGYQLTVSVLERYWESAGGVWQAYLQRCDALTWKNASVIEAQIWEVQGADELVKVDDEVNS